jgi:hypothetical protein
VFFFRLFVSIVNVVSVVMLASKQPLALEPEQTRTIAELSDKDNETNNHTRTRSLVEPPRRARAGCHLLSVLADEAVKRVLALDLLLRPVMNRESTDRQSKQA